MIYCIAADAAGLIKIGKAKDIKARLSAIRCHSPLPLRLISTAPGDLEEEMAAHAFFREFRSHGEWFHASPEVLAFAADPVAGLKSIPRIPAPVEGKRGEVIELTCRNCGELFARAVNRYSARRPFCSVDCRDNRANRRK